MNAYATKMRDALLKFKTGAQMRLDGWVNTATGFGTSRDKSEYGFVLPSRILTDTELSTLYHADDMAQRMVDVVPQEMFREGFAFETGDPLVDAALNDKFDTLEAPAKFAEGARWGRCFGGAGILIGADDGRDSDLPLIPEKADDVAFLYVIDRRLLWPLSYYDEPGHPKLGQPKTYLVTTIGGTHFNTTVCHESRLILFRGANTGIRERHQLMGWDMSVLQRVYDVLRSFNTGWKSVETLLVDGNQAIFKMTGLAESLSSGGEEILRARMQAMDLYRSVMRAMVIDADGQESFERQAANFSGIPDTLEKFMLRLAAAVQIPVTILMGQSPAGMNATGDSDFRWFYDRIKAEQTMIAAPKIKRLGKIWLRTRAGQEHTSSAAKMMNVKFPALWTETPSDQATRENTIATRDKTYIDSQVLSPEEVALHRFGSPDGFDREILITQEAIAARKSVLSGDIAKMTAPETEEVTDPLAVEESGAGAPSEGGSMLKLTASDLASIVKVNEARASVGLGPLPGKEGEMTLPQFKATFASTIAAVANAERGTDPNAPPPEAPPGAPKLDAGDRFDARSTILLVDRDGKIEKSEHPSKAAARKAATEYLKSNGGKGKLVMAPKGMEHLVTPVPAQLHESGGDGENGDDRPRDEMGRFTSDAHALIDSITIRETMDAIEICVTENGATSALSFPPDDQMKITIETNGKPKVTTEPSRTRFDASLRTFTLQRDEDESGFSGTGPVARGCIFEDGKVAMRWRTATASTTMFESIADVIKIHGHGGKTRVVFDDERADGEDQERDENGRFAGGGGGGGSEAAAKQFEALRSKVREVAKASGHLDGWEEQERDELGRFGSGGGSGSPEKLLEKIERPVSLTGGRVGGGSNKGASAPKEPSKSTPKKGEPLSKRDWTETRLVGKEDETWKEHFNGHPDEGGQPTAERAREVHEPMIRAALEGKVTAASLGEKPTAVLTMGGPASGKGVILGKLKESGMDLSHFVHVDPDEVKSNLPEYKASVPSEDAVAKGTAGQTFKGAAAQVHEESSYVAKQIRDQAIAGGHHVVIDGTGGNADKFISMMNDLKEKGYEVHVFYPHLDANTGVQRAAGRAERSGRFVPEKVIRGTYAKIDQARDRIMAAAPNITVFDSKARVPGDQRSSHAVVMTKKEGQGETIHDPIFMNNLRAKK